MAISAFVAILGTARANVPKAEAALKEHVARFQNEPATAEEVAAARSYVVGNQAMDHRTNARQAWYLAAADEAIALIRRSHEVWLSRQSPFQTL